MITNEMKRIMMGKRECRIVSNRNFRAKNAIGLSNLSQKMMLFLHRFCTNFDAKNIKTIAKKIAKSSAENYSKTQNYLQKHLDFCTGFCTENGTYDTVFSHL